MYRPRLFGFTLAELLIALLILGTIATFTIPKLLVSQQNERYNALAKEAAGTVAQAYQAYRFAGGVTTTMNAEALSSYYNYVSVDTSSVIDLPNGAGQFTCNGVTPCYRLHNGAVLHSWRDNFCNGSPTGIPFEVDPDGVNSGTTNGPGKAIRFFLYSDGRITTEGTMASNTRWANDGTGTCSFTRSAAPSVDPTWFQW